MSNVLLVSDENLQQTRLKRKRITKDENNGNTEEILRKECIKRVMDDEHRLAHVKQNHEENMNNMKENHLKEIYKLEMQHLKAIQALEIEIKKAQLRAIESTAEKENIDPYH